MQRWHSLCLVEKQCVALLFWPLYCNYSSCIRNTNHGRRTRVTKIWRETLWKLVRMHCCVFRLRNSHHNLHSVHAERGSSRTQTTPVNSLMRDRMAHLIINYERSQFIDAEVFPGRNNTWMLPTRLFSHAAHLRHGKRSNYLPTGVSQSSDLVGGLNCRHPEKNSRRQCYRVSISSLARLITRWRRWLHVAYFEIPDWK